MPATSSPSSWSDGVDDRSQRTDTNITADLSVTANFAPLTYTLTYTAGTGGSISGTSPQTVAYGSDGTEVTAVPDAGYQFTGWSDGVTTAARTDTNITADLSVTANFAPLTYTLTYTAGTGGSISGTSPQTVAYGGSGTAVMAVANTGYTFTSWSDGGTTATRTDTNVTANVSVTANFTPDGPTYPLVYPFDGGQVVFQSVTSGEGINVTRLAPRRPAPAGYRLLSDSYFEITVLHQFSGAATVTLAYDPAQLEGAAESGLRMYRYDESNNIWDITTSVDQANNVVVGTTDEFSDFAVAAPEATEPPPVVSTPASSGWSLAVLAFLGVALVAGGRRVRPTRE
jgi:uncharacterized repeat protein (TIGR02543 family)